MADFVAGPVARRKKDQVKFLVMWTWDILPDGRVARESKLKFAGGMKNLIVDTTDKDAFCRELHEETGLIVRPDALIEPLDSLNGDNDHVKDFMLVWRRDCDGSLRRKNLRDGDTLLGPPFFATREFLRENLYGDHWKVIEKLPT